MTKILRAALTVSALLAFAISCDTGDDSQYAGPDDTTPATRQVEPGDDSQYAGPDDTTPATRQVEADSATPTPKVVWVVKWPDSWPVPPLPVMWLEHQSGPARGSPQRYCWQFEDGSDPVCEEYTIWSGVREYPEDRSRGAHPHHNRRRHKADQDVRQAIHPNGKHHGGRFEAAVDDLSRARPRGRGARGSTTSA